MIRALLLAVLLLGGCAADAQRAKPGDVAFALFGDMPYSHSQINLMEDTIDEINAAPLAFAVHLGDITSGTGPCNDAWLEARARQFERIAHPFVLVLGDNEWTDCYRTGFDPLERLAKLRALFHAGAPRLPEFARQSAAFPEHARWRVGRALFVTLNVPGSNNNRGRTAAMDAESAARMQAVLAWLDAAVALAATPKIDSLVVLMHANPSFGKKDFPIRHENGADGYTALRVALRAHARHLRKPLVVAHGDTHGFKHDRPEPEAGNLVRIEVDGWPAIGWLQVRLPASPGGFPGVERLLRR